MREEISSYDNNKGKHVGFGTIGKIPKPTTDCFYY